MLFHKKSGKIARVAFLAILLQTFSPILSAQQQPPRPPRPWHTLMPVALTGLTVGLGALGWHIYRDRKTKQARQQLPKEVNGLIDEYLVPADRKDLLHTVKLLPSICGIQKVNFDSALEHFFKMHQQQKNILEHCPDSEQVRTYLDEYQKNLAHNRAVALWATIVAQGNVQQLDLLQKQKDIPQNLFIKGETPIHTILGVPLLPGQVAFISYSDGSISIECNDSDQQKLDALSPKQRAFLDKIYATKRTVAGVPSFLVTVPEYAHYWWLFDASQRASINQFYNIRYDMDGLGRTFQGFVFGAMAAAVVGMFYAASNRQSYWNVWSKNWNAQWELAGLKNPGISWEKQYDIARKNW